MALEKISVIDLNSISMLQETAAEFLKKQQNKQNVSSTDLIAATTQTNQIFALLKSVALIAQNKELEKLMLEAITLTAHLHAIAMNEAMSFASPNQVMQGFTRSFERFVDNTMSKRVRTRLRRALAFVPCIDGIITVCSDLPYYFEHANGPARFALILATTLLLVALAFTIASYASPVLLAIPFLPFAISAVITVGRMFYDQVVMNSKEKYEDKEKINATLTHLEELKADMEAFRRETFINQLDDKEHIDNDENVDRSGISAKRPR